MIARQDDPVAVLGAELRALDAMADADVSHRMVAIEDDMMAMVPTSIAGALAQLRLLCQIAEDFEWDKMHDRLAGNLIAGMKRLAGGAQ